MLVELLRLLAGEGVYPVSELARQLEISPELVQQMISDLVKQDYLQPLATPCDSPCSACPLGDGVCSIYGMKQAWILTLKGRRVVRHFERP